MFGFVSGAWLYYSLERYCTKMWCLGHITEHPQSNREIIRKSEKSNPRAAIFQAQCAQCAAAMATAELLHSTSTTFPTIHTITLSDHINLVTILHLVTQDVLCMSTSPQSCACRSILHACH